MDGTQIFLIGQRVRPNLEATCGEARKTTVPRAFDGPDDGT
jgi:hypothetical protein